MNFSFIFMLSFISFAVFIYTCSKILNDSKFFFGIDIPNKGARAIIMFMFIGTFVSVLFFFVSKYIRELSDRTIPKHGQKGIRGLRGEEGKASDDCDPIKCKEIFVIKKYLIIYHKFIVIFLKKKKVQK